MKSYIQTNKATTNIFGPHTQPRKTTRYTNIEASVGGGGGGGWTKKSRWWGEKEKEPSVCSPCKVSLRQRK